MSQAQDSQIGDNLRELRGEIKQADLAREMKIRGFAWAQNTVHGVETGKRPLRMTEAVALSEILGFALEDLLQKRPTKAEHYVKDLTENLEYSTRQTVQSIKDLALWRRRFLYLDPPRHFTEEEQAEAELLRAKNLNVYFKSEVWECIKWATHALERTGDFFTISTPKEELPEDYLDVMATFISNVEPTARNPQDQERIDQLEALAQQAEHKEAQRPQQPFLNIEGLTGQEEGEP